MKKNNTLKTNFQIKSQIVRLLDENGKMLGVFDIHKAIEKAKKKGLDIIEISNQNNPVVCKIVNLNKYKYFIKKKKLSIKKKQKNYQLKEIRLRPNIASGDLDTKIRSAKKIIKNGNKVKIVLFLKGREILHQEIGKNILYKFIQISSEFAKKEIDIKKEGKKFFIIIAPLKS